MNFPEAEFLTDDVLFRIEIKIARRADELMRCCEHDGEPAHDYWGQVECEVWASADIAITNGAALELATR